MTHLSFSSSELVMLACAPMLMVVVSLFERRWGPMVAGIVAAAPLTALIGLLLVHSNLGAGASHEMALRMSGYIPAQIGIALVVVALVARTRFVPALLVGVMTYGVLASVSAHLPVELAVASSLLLLLAGRRLVRAPAQTNENHPMVTTGLLMILLRAAVSLTTAVGLLFVADQFGPAAGGAVGAFPIFTFTLCCFVYATAGARGVSRVLAGMVRGLPPYFAFVLTYGITGPRIGIVYATIAGILVCACCYVGSAWGSRRRSREATPAGHPGEADEYGRASSLNIGPLNRRAPAGSETVHP